VKGSVNRNVAPPSDLFAAQIRPPCCATIECAIDRPRPIPCDFVMKNDSKSFGKCVAAIPCPRSITAASAPSLSERAVRTMSVRRAGYQFGITALFILLCEAMLLRGRCDAVPEVIEQALSTCNVNTERFFEAELYRLKARVLLLAKDPNASVHAQSLLDNALTIARSQSARSLELRAARALVDLWRDQGKRDEARDLRCFRIDSSDELICHVWHVL
jgi:hypothetical protein